MKSQTATAEPMIESGLESGWAFPLRKCEGVLATEAVAEGLASVTAVYRDEKDGQWQFLDTGSGRRPRLADAVIVPLAELVEADPTLAAIALLEPGWLAVRLGKGHPWQMRPYRRGLGRLMGMVAHAFHGRPHLSAPISLRPIEPIRS